VKNAVVPMADGSHAVVYCQESPEPYFEDFGRGSLVAGVAHVDFEPRFASIVHRNDYMVFVTPGADSKGLYVTGQTPQGFDVRESQGGKSSLPFTYRIVAKRRDVDGPRLATVNPEHLKVHEKVRAQGNLNREFVPVPGMPNLGPQTGAGIQKVTPNVSPAPPSPGNPNR